MVARPNQGAVQRKKADTMFDDIDAQSLDEINEAQSFDGTNRESMEPRAHLMAHAPGDRMERQMWPFE